MNKIEKWALCFKDEDITIETLAKLEPAQRKIAYLAFAALETGKLPRELNDSKDKLKAVKKLLTSDDDDSPETPKKVSKVSIILFGAISDQKLFDKIAAYRQDVHNAQKFISFIHGKGGDSFKECTTYEELNKILLSKEQKRRQEIERFQQITFKRRCILEIYVIVEHLNTLLQASQIINVDEDFADEIEFDDDDLPSNITPPKLTDKIKKILKKFKEKMSDADYKALHKEFDIKDIASEKAKEILDRLNVEIAQEFKKVSLQKEMLASKEEVLKIKEQIDSQKAEEKRLKTKYGLKKITKKSLENSAAYSIDIR